MAATVMASMGSLAFAAAGARAGGFPVRVPASALAPRRRALQVVRAQAEDAEPTTEETSPAFSSSTSPRPLRGVAGATPQGGRSGGVMSADAELWNGRFAMLGLVALAFNEYLTGAPFINA